MESKVLFDFTSDNASVSGWVEQSDVVREPGMSKATLVIQKSKLFKRAVFFTLLNPQPNGAGFAGMKISVQWDLSNHTSLLIRLRGQGSNSHYKVNLRHKGLDTEPHPSYEQMFEAPMNSFGEINLPLNNFEPYYRGRKLDPKEVGYLDLHNITNFEFQMYGGVYLPYKQSGPSSLEIDWVKAV